MKAVTKYIADNGAQCDTAEEALVVDYLYQMNVDLGVSGPTALVVLEKWEDIHFIVTKHKALIETRRLEQTA